jgi:hypothetical protein
MDPHHRKKLLFLCRKTGQSEGSTYCHQGSFCRLKCNKFFEKSINEFLNKIFTCQNNFLLRIISLVCFHPSFELSQAFMNYFYFRYYYCVSASEEQLPRNSNRISASWHYSLQGQGVWKSLQWRSMQTIAVKLSGLISGGPDTRESARLCKSVAQSYFNRIIAWSPNSGLFFRDIGVYPNLSQIMKKFIPYIYNMLRNFAATAYTVPKLKCWRWFKVI